MILEASIDDIGYTVSKVDKDNYILKSADGAKEYHITKKGDNWACDCPSFKYRHHCKHLDALYADKAISKPIVRRSMNIIDDVVIPVLDSVMSKYFYNWKDYIVGSYRRKKGTFKDVDVLIPLSVDEFNELSDELSALPGFRGVMAGEDIFRGMVPLEGQDPVEVDFSRIEPQRVSLARLYRTGPADLNKFMRYIAMSYGWSLSENGLRDHITGKLILPYDATEEDLFKALDLPYLTPEERENFTRYIDVDGERYDANRRIHNMLTSPDSIVSKIAGDIDQPVIDKVNKSRSSRENAVAYYLRPIATKYAVSPYKSEMLAAWTKATGENFR